MKKQGWNNSGVIYPQKSMYFRYAFEIRFSTLPYFELFFRQNPYRGECYIFMSAKHRNCRLIFFWNCNWRLFCKCKIFYTSWMFFWGLLNCKKTLLLCLLDEIISSSLIETFGFEWNLGLIKIWMQRFTIEHFSIKCSYFLNHIEMIIHE